MPAKRDPTRMSAERERVKALLGQGKDHNAIAKSLGISVTTLYARHGALSSLVDASEPSAARVVATPLAKTRPRGAQVARNAGSAEGDRLVDVLRPMADGGLLSDAQQHAIVGALRHAVEALGAIVVEALADEPGALAKVKKALERARI